MALSMPIEVPRPPLSLMITVCAIGLRPSASLTRRRSADRGLGQRLDGVLGDEAGDAVLELAVVVAEDVDGLLRDRAAIFSWASLLPARSYGRILGNRVMGRSSGFLLLLLGRRRWRRRGQRGQQGLGGLGDLACAAARSTGRGAVARLVPVVAERAMRRPRRSRRMGGGRQLRASRPRCRPACVRPSAVPEIEDDLEVGALTRVAG